MPPAPAVPEIFDRNARRLRRDRTANLPEPFFTGLMIDELLARLDDVRRVFSNALVIGVEPRLIECLRQRVANVTAVDPSARRAGSIANDEDRLSLSAASYDLVIGCGTLDSVADLPGALIIMRRALIPDGLCLACFPGAGSLPKLRAATGVADLQTEQTVARFHPQVDVRAAGDLLVRAGFALPVADIDMYDLAYRDLGRLVSDLRAAAMTNVLAKRYPVSRQWLATATDAFDTHKDDTGRVHEKLALLTLTGWAPSPDQPKPAARGSGKISLSSALRPDV